MSTFNYRKICGVCSRFVLQFIFGGGRGLRIRIGIGKEHVDINKVNIRAFMGAMNHEGEDKV
jgi:hypothetical protein